METRAVHVGQVEEHVHDLGPLKSLHLDAGNRVQIEGGLGRGGPCALCGQLLTPTGMEIEIEFGRKGTTSRLDTYVLHPRCFAAWELLRDTLQAVGPAESAAD